MLKRKSKTFLSFIYLVFASVYVFSFVSPALTYAIDADQAEIYNNGIYYYDLESGCAVTNTGTTLEVSGKDNREIVYKFFVGKGYKPFQAAAIIGNMTVESGVQPQRLQGTPSGQITRAEEWRNINGGGWGLVQWTPGSKMINPTTEAGKDPNDILVQLEFLESQLRSSTIDGQAGKQLRDTTRLEDAVLAFQGNTQVGGRYIGFERPADQSGSVAARAAAARGALTEFSGISVAGAAIESDAAATADPCCNSAEEIIGGEAVADGSPSDWIKMYTGANKQKVDGMGKGPLSNPKALIIHFTVGSQEGQDLLNFFYGTSAGTGIQFNVGKTGKIYQYYPLNAMQMTYHAKGVNSKAIGIEITGRDAGELLGNDAQFKAVASLAGFLCDEYSIPCGEPKGKITGDSAEAAQGMLGHGETPTNDHTDPDHPGGEAGYKPEDSSTHAYMKKLRSALGFDPTPGKSGGEAGTPTAQTGGSASGSCAETSSSQATGNGTAKDPVGDGINRDLALEAVKYDTKANNGKYTYRLGGLHGPLSQLEDFAANGGQADCSGFIRYVIWKVHGVDPGSFTTGSMTSNSNFKRIDPSEVAAGDIGWRSEHVDFITENKGGGNLHQFGAHSTANDLYGGDTTIGKYDRYYRYVGPKAGDNV